MMSLWDALRMNMMISYQELVRTFLSKAMDSDDKLIVVNATNNSAYWYNIPKAVENHLQDQWYK